MIAQTVQIITERGVLTSAPVHHDWIAYLAIAVAVANMAFVAWNYWSNRR